MDDKLTTENEVRGRNLLLKTEKKNIKLENKDSSHCNDKIAENCSKEIEQKLSDHEVTIKRSLSEGEASSGFETVSSVDSNVDPDDFDLSSTADEDDFNVVVQIENELAFQTHKGSSERTFYWRDTCKTPARYKNRSMQFISDYTNRRHDDFKIINRKKNDWESNIKDKNYKYDENRVYEDVRDKNSKERETFTSVSHHSSHDNNWERSNNCSKKYLRNQSNDFRCRVGRNTNRCFRSRHSRSSDFDSRHRYYRKSDYDSRSKGSGSSEYKYRHKHSVSKEQITRYRTLRSSEKDFQLNNKKMDRKAEARHSINFGINSVKSNLERNSAQRKRKCNLVSKSPTSSILKPLKSIERKSRKKERTPFLVELERKLKEADQLKESKREIINSSVVQTEASTNRNNKLPVPEDPSGVIQNSILPQEKIQLPMSELPVKPVPPPNAPVSEMLFETTQNSIPPYLPKFTPPTPSIPIVGIPFQYTFPTMSVDNLPLVPGPTGVPVHITLTGEQIPHDLDGRRIPVGPNGHYLPLDPTGRLFPHIVSPSNQAIPIHMAKDGVLRLPNLDPVPYGPAHKLPVNIDGMVIPIGPDSKPLYPCSDLPRQPPTNLLKMFSTETMPAPKIPVSQGMPLTAEAGNQETVPPVEPLEEQRSNENNIQLPNTDFELADIILDSRKKINKANLLKYYKRKARERSEDVLKCIEIEKNLGVNPSKGGVKRSTPMKLSQKKICKEDSDTSGSDMVLDSDDSDSTSDLQPESKRKKDSETSKTAGTNGQAKPKDLIAKKVEQAIKSLSERNYKPPMIGRFIVSKQVGLAVKKFSNESPLLRNRVVLPFLTPSTTHSKDESLVQEITFTFLSRKMCTHFRATCTKNGTTPQKVPKNIEEPSDTVPCENSNPVEIPVFTCDFAVQCDFTNEIIKDLKSKLADLEAEVVQLRNINANLLDDYRNAQTMNEERSDELRKALLEVKNLKRSVERRGKR